MAERMAERVKSDTYVYNVFNLFITPLSLQADQHGPKLKVWRDCTLVFGCSILLIGMAMVWYR